MERDTLDTAAVGRLVGLIEAQSTSEAEQILADARERAQRIRMAAEASAEALRASARHEGETRGRRRAARLLALAEARARTDWLRAREQLLDAVIDQARARLADPAAGSEAAMATMRRLVDEAVRALPPQPLRLRVPAAYAGLLRQLCGEYEATFVVDDDQGVPGGGVIVETEDGRLRFDNSYDARIHGIRDELRWCVAAHLFGDQRSWLDRYHPGAAGSRSVAAGTMAAPR